MKKPLSIIAIVAISLSVGLFIVPTYATTTDPIEEKIEDTIRTVKMMSSHVDIDSDDFHTTISWDFGEDTDGRAGCFAKTRIDGMMWNDAHDLYYYDIHYYLSNEIKYVNDTMNDIFENQVTGNMYKSNLLNSTYREIIDTNGDKGPLLTDAEIECKGQLSFSQEEIFTDVAGNPDHTMKLLMTFGEYDDDFEVIFTESVGSRIDTDTLVFDRHAFFDTGDICDWDFEKMSGYSPYLDSQNFERMTVYLSDPNMQTKYFYHKVGDVCYYGEGSSLPSIYS